MVAFAVFAFNLDFDLPQPPSQRLSLCGIRGKEKPYRADLAIVTAMLKIEPGFDEVKRERIFRTALVPISLGFAVLPHELVSLGPV